MRDGFESQSRFRKRCLSGAVLAGTFQKSPSRHVGEILARSGLDFAVLDAEHAPFGIEAIDDVIAPTRPLGFPMLVRVPELRPALVGACLDAGASGIVVPHVKTTLDAQAAVAAARFAAGDRGLSPSARAGDYGGRGLVELMEASDAAVSVWCQIEDVEGVDNVEAISRVPGVDALFVGRADLMRSLKATSIQEPAVQQAVARVAAAGRQSGTPLAIFIGHIGEAAAFRELGFSIFICGSDQSLLKAEAANIKRHMAGMAPAANS
jgi:2-keto-3-deoxy-L-rhamnonate aldolase RhmA